MFIFFGHAVDHIVNHLLKLGCTLLPAFSCQVLLVLCIIMLIFILHIFGPKQLLLYS